MTKKKEALNKAKESGKEIVKGGKELGTGTIQVLGGTAGALSYTLLSAGERENVRAGNHLKNAIKGTGIVLKGGARIAGHSLKGGYHLIDAGDKAIGEYIEKKQLEKGKRPGKIGRFFRDNIMKLMMVLGLSGYLGYEATNTADDKQLDKQEIVVNDEGKEESFKIVEDNEVYSNDSKSDETLLIPTNEYNLLNGKTITVDAQLTRRYLGGDLKKSGSIIIGDTLKLNSAESLHNLWAEKIRKYGQSTNDISKLDKKDVSSMSQEEIESFRVKYPIDATYLLVIKPYIDGKEMKDKMSLKQFMKQTNQIVENLKSDIKSYDGKLTGPKKDLFDAMRNDINGECIVAYAMTELCENKENGEFNKQLFDFLLKNSGVNYLSMVPAIHDGKTSYGLFQFTEFALYDRGGEKRGASVINEYLPDGERIPGSVIDLKTWQDQTKAAYMFAVQNLRQAVKNLTDEEAKDLLAYQKRNKEKFRDNMTQLIAMCHHMPVAASNLKKWHKDNYERDMYSYGGKNTKPYGKASKINYKALIKK